MATNISTRRDLSIKSQNPSCLLADQCCWYETTNDSNAVCHNRNTLICQQRREEVFGAGSSKPRSVPAVR
jgi:hypothetical protein